MKYKIRFGLLSKKCGEAREKSNISVKRDCANSQPLTLNHKLLAETNMSHTAKIELQDPEGKSGIYPCYSCRRETSQAILTIVNATDSECDGLVQFWNHYLTVRCHGCGTVNFCIISECSEEEDFDSQGRPFLVRRMQGYPEVQTEDLGTEDIFVNGARLAELDSLPKTPFDTVKLLQMVIELNRCYKDHSYLSCIYLVRAILDHVPPIFGLGSFVEVTNNYAGGGRSFRDAMQHLQNTSRKIADTHLHSQIRSTESVPNKNQVEFRPDLDVLLSEIVRVLRPKP